MIGAGILGSDSIHTADHPPELRDDLVTGEAVSGAHGDLPGSSSHLQLRKIPIRRIVDSRINAVKSGIVDSNGDPVSIDDMSTHFLAGGHVEMVIQSLINARKANIDLTFDRACAIDLATKGTNKNVEDAVHRSVNPQVIDVPPAAGSKKTIDGVAKDGIMIKARARVTVRTNLASFVGGATEDTIVARVGEGIVSSIGSEHKLQGRA